VPKSECAFSFFDQVRLGIRNDGSAYHLLQAKKRQRNDRNGDEGDNDELQAPSHELLISDEDRAAAKVNVQECMDNQNSVCHYETPLLLPSSIKDIYITMGHPAKPYVIEVSGIEPLILTLHSKDEMPARSNNNNSAPMSFEKSHNFVNSKIENNFNCGNLKRILRFSSKHGQEESSIGKETLVMKLTDGLGRSIMKDMNVILAARPDVDSIPRYVLTQNTAKVLVIPASGVQPLKLKYEQRQSDFTDDGQQLQLNVDIAKTTNTFKFSFQPTHVSGTSVYALRVTDANGATKMSFITVEVIPPPTYSFIEVDENHNEIILTEGHEKKIQGELEGFEPLTFSTFCENKPAKIQVTSTNSESQKKTKAAFTAVLPSFAKHRQNLVPCKVSLKDGNGAEQSSTFYLRVAPLPGFDFGNGNSKNSIITATVGYLAAIKVPKSYGYTPLKLEVMKNDDEIINYGQGLFIEHPDKDTTILNVMAEKPGTTQIGLFLIDANGIKGKPQYIKLISVNPPTIKLEDKKNTVVCILKKIK
jgi:hypothetical protein